jgi:hydroxymethylpyrimidine pyrophosphatase-like HAD family hydrolase
MTINAITLLDLDDTVFQTSRKCPEDIPHVDLTPYAFGTDGNPISYATPSQVAFIRWLETTTRVVVVTARSVDALLRSKVKFQTAVAAHGGAIIGRASTAKSGEYALYTEWHKLMETQLQAYKADLNSIIQSVNLDADLHRIDVRARVIEEQGLPLYVVVKHGLKDGNDAELYHACASTTKNLPPGWTAHVNGNNVAYMPPGLGKEHAVKWLLPQLKEDHPGMPVIGIGDSFTDAGFMQLCDFAMTPTASQLSTKIFGSKFGQAA